MLLLLLFVHVVAAAAGGQRPSDGARGLVELGQGHAQLIMRRVVEEL